jgi:hypothetical protein
MLHHNKQVMLQKKLFEGSEPLTVLGHALEDRLVQEFAVASTYTGACS